MKMICPKSKTCTDKHWKGGRHCKRHAKLASCRLTDDCPACVPADKQAEGGPLVLSAGICDFCGEHAPALKAFDRAPMVGAAYCRKCAPLSETDADWPNDTTKAEGGAR